MIDLLIYQLHIVAILYAFTKKWQVEGLKGGLLAIGLCALVFIIGWSLTGTIARLIMPGVSQPGDLITSDTVSLILLLIPEVLFFRMFFIADRAEAQANNA